MSIPTRTREYRLPTTNGPKSLLLREADVTLPKSDEVLINIKAVSLQHRDLVVSRNSFPNGTKENPVPCSDCAGEIIAVGDNVADWKTGDRVCVNYNVKHMYGPFTRAMQGTELGAPIDGVLTEYKTVPAAALVRMPAGLSYEEASTLPCAGVTAYNALSIPPVKAGDTVLIIGTGGVSIFGLQIARAAGATVICTSSSDDKLEKAKKLGAKHVINYKKVQNWEDKVIRLTNGDGVDYVLEVGGLGTLPKSLQAVKIGGTVAIIGIVAGAGDASSAPMTVLIKGVSLRGVLIGSVELFEKLVRLIEANDVHPVVDKVFEFEQAREAYEYLESQQHVGKVVIRVAKN